MVFGLFQGAAYGLLASGLVVVYRSTGVLNFAQAEFGSIAAFALSGLFANAGLPYGVAALGALAVALLAGLVTERVVMRPLQSAPGWSQTLATAGVALLLIALTVLVAPAPRNLAPLVPGGKVVIGGAALTAQHVLLGTVALAVVVALLAGTRGRAVSRGVWGLAALLGGLAGALEVPLQPAFAPGFMTLTALIPALTAVLIGGASVRGAFLAAEAVGVIQAFGLFVLGDLRVPGAGTLAVFLLLVTVLLVRPGVLQEEG